VHVREGVLSPEAPAFAALRLRREDVQTALDRAPLEPFANVDIAANRTAVASSSTSPPTLPRAALLGALTHDIRIDTRATIR
jgi:hypothetical protein